MYKSSSCSEHFKGSTVFDRHAFSFYIDHQQFFVMLRSIIAVSVLTASVLACPQHGNYHYPGAQIKKRADAGHERDWDYAASYDWASVSSGEQYQD
jgi:hypothetical protein